jgi:hypothetical protein
MKKNVSGIIFYIDTISIDDKIILYVSCVVNSVIYASQPIYTNILKFDSSVYEMIGTIFEVMN